MKKESLQRAKQLEPLIHKAQENIDRWEKATGFKSDLPLSFPSSSYSYADPKFIPFNIFKLISIDGFEKELAALEAELNSL